MAGRSPALDWLEPISTEQDRLLSPIASRDQVGQRGDGVRHGVGSDDRAATKSVAGRRVIGLPGPLVELLAEHRASQDCERQAARQLWAGYVNPSWPRRDGLIWPQSAESRGLRL